MDKTEFGWEIARLALEALRQGFAAQYDSTIPEALARGFAAANACVRAANRGERGRRRGERVFVGAAAMALDGQELIFAHVPPSQIVFTQDRMVYTIPSLHSWEAHYAGSDRSSAEPLGVRDQIQPDLFQTSVIEQDTVVLCSTNLGRAIATLPVVAERLRPPTEPSGRPLASLPVGPAEHPITMLDMGSVRPAGPDPATAWVDWLDLIAEERNIASCHAVAATVGQIEGRSSGAGTRSRPRERASRPLSEPEPAAPASFPTRSRFIEFVDRTGRPQLMHQPLPPVEFTRYQRQLDANGVRRFANKEGVLPESWRVRVPRIALRHSIASPQWLTVILVLLVLLAGGTGIGYLRSATIKHDLELALARIDGQLADAESDDDASALGTLRGHLRTLAARYGSSPALDQRLIQLTTVEDRLLGRLRLEAPLPLGTLPGESIPSERTPRLLHVENDVFLVGTSLYQIDPRSNQLIYSIGAGDTVDGLALGPIIDAVATRSGIAVTDGVALFDRDSRGTWSAEPFDARLDLSAEQVAAIVIVDDQMVVFDAASGALVVAPLTAPATGGTPAVPASMLESFAGALDLALNDDLLILDLAGNLVSYDQRGQATRLSVPVTPPINRPRAMDASDENLWILDTGNGSGRLVCYSPEGDSAVVYELPVTGIEATGPLATASDFAIDSANGRVIFLDDESLWYVPLPTAG